MRIIYFGTTEFSVSQLKAIRENNYDIVCIVTIPDKMKGRGKKIQYSEVKEYAIENNLPYLQPDNLEDPEFLDNLKSYNADLFVVIAFRLLPFVVFNMPKLGTINLHASLLPKYRGAAPINHAIINGDNITGISTFFLNSGIDEGDIILQRSAIIRPDETFGELNKELMNIGNEAIIETLKILESGKHKLWKQRGISTKAPKITKEFCNINWDNNCKDIYNLIRGLSPYPAAHTKINDIEIKIYESSIELVDHTEKPGNIETDYKTYLKIAARDGYIHLLNIQRSGKNRMNIEEFLRGFRKR